MGRRKNEYGYQALDFKQPFAQLDECNYLFQVYRFRVYLYIPVVEHKNLKYYFLKSESDVNSEKALFGLCFYRQWNQQNNILYYNHKMLFSGDPEMGGYITKMLLSKLLEQKKGELEDDNTPWIIKSDSMVEI